MGKGSSYRNCYRNNINIARYHDNVHKKGNHVNNYSYKKFKKKDYDGYDNYSIEEIQVVLDLLIKYKSRKIDNLTNLEFTKNKRKEYEKEIRNIEYKQKILQQLYNVKLKPQVKEFVDNESKKYLIPFDTFKNRIRKGIITPGSGYGYYASGDTVYNIAVNPIDIIDGHYRTDFDHVYWITYSLYYGKDYGCYNF